MSTKRKKAKEGKKEMEPKKEQTVAQFLKDKVEEDESSSELRMRKLNESWRIMSRLCENEDQRSQIDEMKQSMERQLDGMDDCIQKMKEELREKERRSAQAHQCHLKHISQLNELQKKRMGLLQQDRERGMTRIKKCYRLKREQMSLEDMFQSLNMEADVPDIPSRYEELLRDTTSNFCSIIDFHDRNIQEQGIKQRTETLKKIQRDLQRGTYELQGETDKNQARRARLDSKIKEVEKDKKKMKALKSKQSSQEINASKVKAQLVDAAKQNQTLRTKIKRSRARSRKRLTKLTVESDKAARGLKTVIAQGEGVLRRAALCKKMEDRLNMTEELQEAVEENPHKEGVSEQEECDFPELNHLTRQMSQAVEQRNALRRQRNDLRCQNKQLKQQKQEMQSSQDNMEIRGGAACRAQNTPSNPASST